MIKRKKKKTKLSKPGIHWDPKNYLAEFLYIFQKLTTELAFK